MKYEYKILTHKITDLEYELNHKGSFGWKAFEIHRRNNWVDVIYMKEITTNADNT